MWESWRGLQSKERVPVLGRQRSADTLVIISGVRMQCSFVRQRLLASITSALREADEEIDFHQGRLRWGKKTLIMIVIFQERGEGRRKRDTYLRVLQMKI